MAMGKYSRVDGRKSNYCSTISIVVFVSLCLIGAWMLMSSSVEPAESSKLTSQGSTDEVKQSVDESGSRRIKVDTDGSSEELRKEPSNDASEKEPQSTVVESSDETDESKNTVDENQEDQSQGKESSDEKTESQEESQPATENGRDGKSKEEESKSENGDSNTESGSSETEKTEQTETTETVDEDNSESDMATQTDKENSMKNGGKDQASTEVFPAGDQSEILNETNAQNGAWSTQAIESKNEKESKKSSSYKWKVCNSTAGPDYIPCLDNWQAIRKLPTTMHYEHRERHCPEEAPTCVVPVPEGYRRSIKWPKSRDKIWYNNVPHTKLALIKGHQNWVKVTGEYLTFPGGGTQFKNGALHYIDFLQDSRPEIAWGNRTRVILDVGCGVASFGGYLSERDVLAMSLAPKDEHEAQVQFALERGIPAVLNVMGTKRLPYPSSVFDAVHCARCRVPWHVEGGKLLLELNRVLRPGGYFIWSATPVYQKLPEDVGIWKAMSELTKKMCWDLKAIKKDRLNGVAAAIYRKPTSNECYNNRPNNEPPLCEESDDPNAAWNVPLQACMHKVPVDSSKRGSHWPAQWPQRLEKIPSWLKSEVGVYGKSASEDFVADHQHWKRVFTNSYSSGMGIDWSSVRNVMDMRAIYGGFAAALRDLQVWVMNVVPIDSADTLPIIYERGLFGIYHDWCESFNTYPRTYDLLHADHLFSSIKKRCNLKAVFAEVDRILRPEGNLIVRDKSETINEIEGIAKSLRWEVRMMYTKNNEGLLCVHKSKWRPTEAETIKAAIM